MKLIKDLQGRVMTTVFGGGCPICGSKNRLTNVGGVFKPCLECSACGSKFEQCSLGSSKYKLIAGNSEYLGKELTVSEWNLLRMGNRESDNVRVLKPNHVTIMSDYSADVTRAKGIAIFKAFGFEIDRTGEEYHAHKGNLFIAFWAGFFVPKCDIYYSLSEAEGKTVINLRTTVSFWKGGGALGMHKQESIFKEVVAAISANLSETVEEKATTTDPVAGDQISKNCGTDLITGVIAKKRSLARSVGGIVFLIISVFFMFAALGGFLSYGESHSAGDLYGSIFVTMVCILFGFGGFYLLFVKK